MKKTDNNEIKNTSNLKKDKNEDLLDEFKNTIHCDNQEEKENHKSEVDNETEIDKINRGINRKIKKAYLKYTSIFLFILLVAVLVGNFALNRSMERYSKDSDRLFYEIYAMNSLLLPYDRTVAMYSKKGIFGNIDIQVQISSYYKPLTYSYKIPQDELIGVKLSPFSDERYGNAYYNNFSNSEFENDKMSLYRYLETTPDSSYMYATIGLKKPVPYMEAYRKIRSISRNAEIGWMRILDMKNYNKTLNVKNYNKAPEDTSLMNIGLNLETIYNKNVNPDQWLYYFKYGTIKNDNNITSESIKLTAKDKLTENDIKKYYIKMLEMAYNLYKNDINNQLYAPVSFSSNYLNKNIDKGIMVLASGNMAMDDYIKNIKKQDIMYVDSIVVYLDKKSMLKVLKDDNVYSANVDKFFVTKFY